jgi:hypothetical protein
MPGRPREQGVGPELGCGMKDDPFPGAGTRARPRIRMGNRKPSGRRSSGFGPRRPAAGNGRYAARILPAVRTHPLAGSISGIEIRPVLIHSGAECAVRALGTRPFTLRLATAAERETADSPDDRGIAFREPISENDSGAPAVR